MIALVDNRPRTLNLKQMLECFIHHRVEVIRRRTQFLLERAQARAHIIEGLRIALAHIDEIIELIKKAPDVETTVVYRDMRTPGQTERFYQAVQEHPMSFLTRGDVESVTGNGNGALNVRVKNSLLGDEIELSADLVVLALGMVPNSADGG